MALTAFLSPRFAADDLVPPAGGIYSLPALFPSASVIPLMAGRPFLLVTFLWPRTASSMAVSPVALLVFPFSLGLLMMAWQ